MRISHHHSLPSSIFIILLVTVLTVFNLTSSYCIILITCIDRNLPCLSKVARVCWHEILPMLRKAFGTTILSSPLLSLLSSPTKDVSHSGHMFHHTSPAGLIFVSLNRSNQCVCTPPVLYKGCGTTILM